MWAVSKNDLWLILPFRWRVQTDPLKLSCKVLCTAPVLRVARTVKILWHRLSKQWQSQKSRIWDSPKISYSIRAVDTLCMPIVHWMLTRPTLTQVKVRPRCVAQCGTKDGVSLWKMKRNVASIGRAKCWCERDDSWRILKEIIDFKYEKTKVDIYITG